MADIPVANLAITAKAGVGGALMLQNAVSNKYNRVINREGLNSLQCPVTPLLRCDPRMGATTVSSMDGHIWRWAGNIPPGFEPEFDPRLAHYSEMLHIYMVWLGLAKHIHIQFGA